MVAAQPTEDESTSSVFVDPSGRRRKVLIAALATIGVLAAGYLTLLLLSVFGAPLPPIAELPLPPAVRDANPGSTGDEPGSPSEAPGSGDPSGSVPATGPSGSAVPGQPGAPGEPGSTSGPAAPPPPPPPPATQPPPPPPTSAPPTSAPPTTASPSAASATTAPAPGTTAPEPLTTTGG